MTTWDEFEEQARRGSMTTRLIADITGLPRSRLDGWHRRGIAPARLWRNPSNLPRLYAWSEYARIRAAQQLNARKVPSRALRSALNRLDATIRDWHHLIRCDHRDAAIVRCSDGGFRYAVAAPRMEGAREVAEPSPIYAAGDDALMIELAEQLQKDGPLGRLSRFEPWVDLRPEVQGGMPTLRGSRIRTALLAEAADAGNTPEQIAGDLGIDPAATGKAIEFHRELEGVRSPRR